MSIVQNIRKTVNYCNKNGYKEAFCAAWERVTARYYADYTYKEPPAEELERQRNDTEISDVKFSIIVPSYETQKAYMDALIKSCLDQTYSNWELVIADGSKTQLVAETVSKYNDERIHYIKLEKNGGIAENTNGALEYATGDYCGLLDHDDLLTADALYEMAHALKEAEKNNITPVIVYSDEDKCNETATHFYEPHFKMDFNLDLLLTNNYVCHFTIVKTDVMKKLQIRKQYDGSQDFDLILRIVSSLLIKEKEGVQEKVENFIYHVPKVLYHWRCHQDSTAENPQSKMYAYEAGRKALADFTKRMGWKADIRHNKHLGFYRIVYRNQVLSHREDLAAVGGYIVHKGKIVSSPYKGQPVFYAGYMNRLDLYQNVKVLDIRNLEVNKNYQKMYEEVTGHPYISTWADSENELPQWIKSMNPAELDKMNKKLSKKFISEGARLLLDPESIRRI